MSQTCAAKIGKPGAMRECGKQVVYRAGTGVTYEGWHHVEPVLDHHHHAVPAEWVR